MKIHKDPLKIRLIINTQNSPIYKIAKKISKELRPLIRSGKGYIKDTEQFDGKIRNAKLEEDETMISFDISDMHPSLSKQDVITEVVRRINGENFKPSMNKKALIELVIISVEFMSFSCNGQYFDQKDGLFIGPPTSPAFAELYIQRVEEIHVYRMIHTPRLWLRKVDDTFVITKYDKIETLDELNKFNCLFDKKGRRGKITNQSISTENTHRTIHALYIESTRTCKSRYHKNTGKKSKSCL